MRRSKSPSANHSTSTRATRFAAAAHPQLPAPAQSVLETGCKVKTCVVLCSATMKSSSLTRLHDDAACAACCNGSFIVYRLPVQSTKMSNVNFNATRNLAPVAGPVRSEVDPSAIVVPAQTSDIMIPNVSTPLQRRSSLPVPLYTPLSRYALKATVPLVIADISRRGSDVVAPTPTLATCQCEQTYLNAFCVVCVGEEGNNDSLGDRQGMRAAPRTVNKYCATHGNVQNPMKPRESDRTETMATAVNTGTEDTDLHYLFLDIDRLGATRGRDLLTSHCNIVNVVEIKKTFDVRPLGKKPMSTCPRVRRLIVHEAVHYQPLFSVFPNAREIEIHSTRSTRSMMITNLWDTLPSMVTDHNTTMWASLDSLSGSVHDFVYMASPPHVYCADIDGVLLSSCTAAEGARLYDAFVPVLERMAPKVLRLRVDGVSGNALLPMLQADGLPTVTALELTLVPHGYDELKWAREEGGMLIFLGRLSQLLRRFRSLRYISLTLTFRTLHEPEVPREIMTHLRMSLFDALPDLRYLDIAWDNVLEERVWWQRGRSSSRIHPWNRLSAAINTFRCLPKAGQEAREQAFKIVQ
ncbi:hypothetical protein CERSUDRAFT_117983 [Gelatoporia subvermispora B]|uniref:Uncharacterized protein n=1 Tax=Ceriporiopsis subvermispora (strain B) TaxID=914234 RepID=M2Q933_CERS8|nr:hypothetical protein CERSUDRAFT_117983 [Gelatoporia subvermispora B]